MLAPVWTSLNYYAFDSSYSVLYSTGKCWIVTLLFLGMGILLVPLMLWTTVAVFVSRAGYELL